MRKSELLLLTGACMLAAGLTGFAGAADASQQTKIYGGGSSLISVYMQQAFNCYGNTQPLIIRSPLSLKTLADFNYAGAKGAAQNCATQKVNTKTSMHYDSASSGNGIAGVFSHDPSSAAPNGYGDIDPNRSGEQDMPSISFGMSDAGLSSTDVGFWNNGNDDQGPTNTCTVKEQLVCVVAPGETAHPPTTYPNPHQNCGALIQFPVSVDPVALRMTRPTRRSRTAPALRRRRTTSTSTSRIRTAAAAGVSTRPLTARSSTVSLQAERDHELERYPSENAQRRQSLQDPQDIADNGTGDWNTNGVPLQIAGRGDRSGTTSIFTRHLSRVCGTPASIFPTTSMPMAQPRCRRACRAAHSMERTPLALSSASSRLRQEAAIWRSMSRSPRFLPLVRRSSKATSPISAQTSLPLPTP